MLSLALAGCGETPPPPVPNETAAYWVLARGGKLTVDVAGKPRQVSDLQALPMDRFTVRAIDLSGVADLHAEGLAEIAHLRPLRSLDLKQSGVTDTGLRHLVGLEHLERLNLESTAVTDGALSAVGRFTRLTFLDLSGTNLTGSGLEDLRPCRKLSELDLSDTPLESEYLAVLKELHNLSVLDLSGTNVSDEAVGELAEALKYCRIRRAAATPKEK